MQCTHDCSISHAMQVWAAESCIKRVPVYVHYRKRCMRWNSTVCRRGLWRAT